MRSTHAPDCKAPGIIITADGMTLSGAGHVVTLDGDGTAQILYVDANVNIRMDHLTVSNGKTLGASGSTGPGEAAFGAGLYNDGGTVTLSQVSFSGNTTIGGDTTAASYEGGIAEGGAIYNTNEGTLTITGSTIEANSAIGGSGTAPDSADAPAYGGGIANDSGIVAIMNTTFKVNKVVSKNGIFSEASGGGFYNDGDSATITDSTFMQNQIAVGDVGSAFGGAIESVAPLTVTNSTFAYNSVGTGSQARGAGGAIDTGSTITITNSTFVGNLVRAGAGGLGEGGAISDFNSVTVVASTLDGDSVTGGQSRGSELSIHGAGSATVDQSIISGSNSGSGTVDCDISGGFSDSGYNLSSDTSCHLAPGLATHDLVGVDPKLGPLGSYGGPTQTVGLLPASPAIGAGPAKCQPATDQRGTPRSQGSHCDIGAFELTAADVSKLHPSSTPIAGAARGRNAQGQGAPPTGVVALIVASVAVVCFGLLAGVAISRRRARIAYREHALHRSRVGPR